LIYLWCTECASRTCVNESSHRAGRLLQYRADFMLGGRNGKRIRKLFGNKKDAESFEYITLADFKRGLFIPADRPKTSVNEFLEGYISQRVKVYMKGWKEEEYRFKPFRVLFGERSLSSLSLNEWERYVQTRLQSKVGKTTINRELTSIKTALKWAVKNSMLKTNPFQDAVKFKEETIKIRWLNEDEIEVILNECTNQGDLDLRDTLVMALNTGFRKANLERVTANDIRNSRIEAVTTKSGKAYQVPINKELANTLQRLVTRHSTGPLLNFYNFRKRFDAIVTDPSVTLHTFRHTFAAQCLKRGIPIDRVCAWMGHHSVEFTRKHYGHLCPNQEAIEIEMLNLGNSKNLTPSVPKTMVRESLDGGA
jgi:integrase